MKKMVLVFSLVLPVLLLMACSSGSPVAYSIGATGPGGGIVFYDSGSEIGTWRYMEMTQTDVVVAADVWAPVGFTWTATGATSTTIGSGQANTDLIVSVYGTGTYAAKLAADLVSGGKSDWFLPSQDELNEAYVNLALHNLAGLGGFYYWSSTEINSTQALSQLFLNGDISWPTKGTSCRIRAIRSFK